MAFFSVICAARPTPEEEQVMELMPSIIAMQSETPTNNNIANWDTDSKPVGLDSRASACISDDERDFVPGTLRPVHRRVKVFGGYMDTKMKIGTLKWTWEDGHGLTNTLRFPTPIVFPRGKSSYSVPSTGPNMSEEEQRALLLAIKQLCVGMMATVN